jgi:hypothetical protein
MTGFEFVMLALVTLNTTCILFITGVTISFLNGYTKAKGLR